MENRIYLVSLLALAFLLPVPRVVQAQQSGSPDTECLVCHGQKDLKSSSGRSVYVNEVKREVGAHAGLTCTTCHTDIMGFPHPARVAIVECATCHAEEAGAVSRSIHSALDGQVCSSCHGSAHEAQPASTVAPRQCGLCHTQEVKDFLSSIHGQAFKNHDPQSPSCMSCHGPAHRILTAQDPTSPTAKRNLPHTCGSCHSDPGFLAKHQIPFARPVETYEAGVHGRVLAAGNEKAASCSDCHASHAIFGSRDPRSKTNHWNVPATCGACHTEIARQYRESVHGQAVAHGAQDAPVCTDCHGEHAILGPQEPFSPVNPANVSSVTCGRCHGDSRLDARYNLPLDRVPTFADSYHGLASRAGSQSVANCASCHGVHNILPSSDARSTVNPANLARTCGACHPGAGSTFAIGPVHVAAGSRDENVVVKWIRRFYWILIPLVLGFMVLHHFADFARNLRALRHGMAGREVPRMNLHFRVAHWLTVVSFPLLAYTGFALKFPGAWWARPLLLGEGHFDFRGTLHRVAAVVLLASVAYHLVHMALVRRDRAMLRHVLPGPRDLRDLGDMFLYNLGLSSVRPTFGVFSYVEKIEYLAFLWGTAVMAGSGFVLWFNNWALRFLPKWVSDAATALHFYEAVLATLSILVWHMYTVIFDPDVYPMDHAWLTGESSAEHLRKTRPAYYAVLRRAAKSKDGSGHPAQSD
jgi:cytochrome b subunit of formate dehydrogenase